MAGSQLIRNRKFSLQIWLVLTFSYLSLGFAIMRNQGQSGFSPTLEIGPSNKRELRELKKLLGTPIGDAHTAKAVIGTPTKTTYLPRCPPTLEKLSKDKRSDFLKLCPSLRNQEYKKHADRVFSIVKNYKEEHHTKYEQQRKALIAAVNDMAKVAGPVPSITT